MRNTHSSSYISTFTIVIYVFVRRRNYLAVTIKHMTKDNVKKNVIIKGLSFEFRRLLSFRHLSSEHYFLERYPFAIFSTTVLDFQEVLIYRPMSDP